jgi:hypothetical protein
MSAVILCRYRRRDGADNAFPRGSSKLSVRSIALD